MPDDEETNPYKHLFGKSAFDIDSMYQDAAAYRVQTQVNILERFGVAETIGAIARELESITQNNPDKHFIVTMRTPDGRMMLVQTIRPEGFSAFVAEGWIDDLKCMVAGHVSTLNVFIAIDERHSKKPVGYTANVFQTRSEPSPPDKPTPKE